MCDERLLTPVSYGTPAMYGKLQKGVGGEGVAAVLAALASNSKCQNDAEDLVTVSKAAEKAKIPAVCVVQLICAGLLQHVVRLEDVSGIEALRVRALHTGTAGPRAARRRGTVKRPRGLRV